MEVQNFYACSAKHLLNRPRFSYKGTVSEIMDFSCPCVCIKGSWSLHHLPSSSLKQHSLVLSDSSVRGNELGVFPNRRICGREATTYTLLRKASRSHSFRPCKVKNDDSEGTLSGESIVVDEQKLELELQIAIQEENYAQAAKIRDSLRVLQEDGKASVLAANARFYNSFKNGDLAAMQALWLKGENACVVHPGVSGISGYELVMGSWEFVWGDYEFPLEIEIKDVQVHVRGDVGCVTCIELVKTKGSNWGRQFATNVFERIDGQWFICIHHASYIDL